MVAMSFANLRKHFRAARDINPMNDWFLARMVAVLVIYLCVLATIMISWK